jgi:hypothetical protein
LSSAKRLPAMTAREKLFFVCNVVSFVNAGDNWPLRSPTTMLLELLAGIWRGLENEEEG